MTVNTAGLEDVAASWPPGALYPSEIQFLVDEILNEEIDIFIECGSQDGFSTRMFSEALVVQGVKVVSIDFCFKTDLKTTMDEQLTNGEVSLVSGDVHIRVPEVIHTNEDKKIAILQDAAKGWQGLSTLLAASMYDNVVLIAQHNLQMGHKSRDFFYHLSSISPFLEESGSEIAQDKRKAEQATQIAGKTDRPMDHSSLGVININKESRDIYEKRLSAAVKKMGPWNAQNTFKQWQLGNLGHVNKLINRQRYMPYRFKKR